MPARARPSARERLVFLASLIAALAVTLAAAAGLTLSAFGPIARGW